MLGKFHGQMYIIHNPELFMSGGGEVIKPGQKWGRKIGTKRIFPILWQKLIFLHFSKNYSLKMQ